MKYKFLLICFLAAFVFLSSAVFCFATELEVNYPTLASGEKITEKTTLPAYLRYVFNFGIAISFLIVFIALIIAGSIYLISAGRANMVADAKSRVFAAISGLVILLTAYLIITTINPELSFFKTSDILELPGLYLVSDDGETKQALGLSGISDISYIKPPKSRTAFTDIKYTCSEPNGPALRLWSYENTFYRGLSSMETINCNGPLVPIKGMKVVEGIEGKSFNFQYETAGVWLSETEDCKNIFSGKGSVYMTSKSDLGEKENKINSAKIQHINPDWYIAILYELKNFRGKCYYINPNIPCDNLKNSNSGPLFANTASSASVYKYEFDPKAGSITFYRKPFYNAGGGWKTVTLLAEDIEDEDSESIYNRNLEELKFEDSNGHCTVPLEEQDCVKWQILKDFKTKCIERKCPSLGGGNISSVKIDGNYIVLFTSFDVVEGKWGVCQEFPTPNDVNKEGPQQIRWEYINYPGRYPNYVFIFPVKEK